jgi:hypothetical protein
VIAAQVTSLVSGRCSRLYRVELTGTMSFSVTFDSELSCSSLGALQPPKTIYTCCDEVVC